MTAGIINVGKPGGITSHDVVNVVRRVSGIRKVGHAGALDPLATGVLVICIGRATRLAEYLTASNKSYHATVRLGIETDTHDADGKVVSTHPLVSDRDQVLKALGTFRGSIQQIPPMYSAIKRQGKPLYKLAREGITVEREPRQAQIFYLEVTDWNLPHFSFDVTCSAGTYVRSLVHDLGQNLGCGAHLTQLTRTASGNFSIDDSVPLHNLTPDNWKSHLQPMDVAVADFPQVVLDEESYKSLVHGQAVVRLREHPAVDLARAHAPDGKFFAIIKVTPDGTSWRPHKVFMDWDS